MVAAESWRLTHSRGQDLRGAPGTKHLPHVHWKSDGLGKVLQWAQNCREARGWQNPKPCRGDAIQWLMSGAGSFRKERGREVYKSQVRNKKTMPFPPGPWCVNHLHWGRILKKMSSSVKSQGSTRTRWKHIQGWQWSAAEGLDLCPGLTCPFSSTPGGLGSSLLGFPEAEPTVTVMWTVDIFEFQSGASLWRNIANPKMRSPSWKLSNLGTHPPKSSGKDVRGALGQRHVYTTPEAASPPRAWTVSCKAGTGQFFAGQADELEVTLLPRSRVSRTGRTGGRGRTPHTHCNTCTNLLPSSAFAGK